MNIPFTPMFKNFCVHACVEGINEKKIHNGNLGSVTQFFLVPVVDFNGSAIGESTDMFNTRTTIRKSPPLDEVVLCWEKRVEGYFLCLLVLDRDKGLRRLPKLP